MNKIKRFVKELKRVRWPKAKDANKSFYITMIFIIITSLILFGLAIGLTIVWDDLGVGIHG